MSVYNDADRFAGAIDSVLAQTFVRFELIIVNDGSTDPRTAEILSAYTPRDDRIHVITKENEGLTKALIAGCGAAVGKYIARIDAGDRYLPGRIQKQQRFLDCRPDIALCSCATRFVDEDGEVIFDVRREDSPDEARRALRADSPRDLKGVTHHGAVMFRRSVYEEVGGYRPEFYFAQDVDLWSRMTDHHGIGFLAEVLYEAHFSVCGISGTYSREQYRLLKLIIAMRRRRDAGLCEDDLLAITAGIRPRVNSPLGTRVSHARGEYFAGCRYEAGNPRKAKEHFWRALRENPLHMKAWVRILKAALGKAGRGSS